MYVFEVTEANDFPFKRLIVWVSRQSNRSGEL